MKRALFTVCSILFVMSIGAPAQSAVPADVVSVFQKYCVSCHKGKTPPQGLSWEAARIAEAIDRASNEMTELLIIDSAAPEASYVLRKVRREKDVKGKPMPPLAAIGADDLKVLETWILGLKKFPVPSSAAGAPPGDGTGQAPSPAAKPASKKTAETPAFWGTHLISLPTTTTPDKGDFLIRISHRFSDPIDTGFDNLFGLDSYANILLAAGYGISDRVTVTIGRARFDKEFEFSADWLVAEQGRGSGLPFSMAIHGGVDLVTETSPDEAKVFAEVSLARQFNRRLSLLVVPALVTNANHWDLEPESTFSLGIGARYMILNEFSITAEWIPVLAGYGDFDGAWGFGVEKKIGGHVFQVFLTNAFGLTAAQYLPGGDLRLGDLDFRIGFNIFRTF